MMALNTKLAIQELLSYTIVTDKGSVISLLKRYGVKLSDKPSDAEVTTAVLVASKKSKAFKKDLSKLLQDKLPKAGEEFKNIVGNSQDFGFTGVDDVTYMPNISWTGTDDFNDFTGWDDFQAATGKKSTKDISQYRTQFESTFKPKGVSTVAPSSMQKAAKGKTGVGNALSSFWIFTKENVLTKDNINSGIQYGIDKINRDTLAKQNALEQQALLLQQQQDAMRSKVGGGISGNTVLYVGVGIIALAGIGFLIYKQSKK
jgi:hypothetical protein